MDIKDAKKSAAPLFRRRKIAAGRRAPSRLGPVGNIIVSPHRNSVTQFTKADRPSFMTAPHQDVFNLERFVTAQRGSYDVALRELRSGAKRSHWMWYVFPQVAGLGSSPMARTASCSCR